MHSFSVFFLAIVDKMTERDFQNFENDVSLAKSLTKNSCLLSKQLYEMTNRKCKSSTKVKKMHQ